jgi:hypothetical protein
MDNERRDQRSPVALPRLLGSSETWLQILILSEVRKMTAEQSRDCDSPPGLWRLVPGQLTQEKTASLHTVGHWSAVLVASCVPQAH